MGILFWYYPLIVFSAACDLLMPTRGTQRSHSDSDDMVGTATIKIPVRERRRL
jgi:hypothetical protein